LISVVMRTHNSQAFLVEAIESVLAQTYPDWELVISDDASTDRTLDIAELYAAKHERIRLLTGQHLGPAENGNRCLRAASAPWVAVLDSDDVALPDRLERTLEAARANPDVVLWGGRAILIDRRNRRMRRASVGPKSMGEYERFVHEGRIIFVMSPTVMFRRDLALRLGGYDDAMDGAEDVELMTRLAERGPVIEIDHDLALYRVHGDSISSTRFAKQQRMFDFLDVRAKLRLGGADLTMPQYLEMLDSQPRDVKLSSWVRNMGRRQYRNTIVNMAERRYVRAAGSGLLAMALDPAHAYHRIRKRLVRA
jgi:glycosyltransferase involved in cell wall biosynthesis